MAVDDARDRRVRACDVADDLELPGEGQAAREDAGALQGGDRIAGEARVRIAVASRGPARDDRQRVGERDGGRHAVTVSFSLTGTHARPRSAARRASAPTSATVSAQPSRVAPGPSPSW